MSLLASAVAHCAVIGIVAYGVLNAPPPVHIVTERYSVRRLDMLLPDEILAKRAAHRDAAAKVANEQAAALAPHPAAMLRVLHSTIGAQTVVQPDVPVQLPTSQKIPLPQIQMWSPPKVVLKNIVAPRPTPPTTAETKPTLETPSHEINLADVNISSSNLPTQKLALMPSSTTAIAMKVVSAVQSAPSRTTQMKAEPAPSAVISVSDLIQKDGPVYLPPMNQTVKLSPQGSSNGSTGTELLGEGDPAQNAKGSGSGKGTANREIAGKQGAGGNSTLEGAASMQGTTTKIALAPTGHFGAVIVGASIEDQYPEAASIWSGRVAYTVYLHVGLARSWVMSYSLPRTAEAAAAGTASRLDAPWPYSIVRPNLNPDEATTDVLMVHGFVNDLGHFENLSVAYPSNFQQTTFILKSLEQWQFRPGAQNGKATRMEVLLIIPEEFQ
jgi:hypothetical protein